MKRAGIIKFYRSRDAAAADVVAHLRYKRPNPELRNPIVLYVLPRRMSVGSASGVLGSDAAE